MHGETSFSNAPQFGPQMWKSPHFVLLAVSLFHRAHILATHSHIHLWPLLKWPFYFVPGHSVWGAGNRWQDSVHHRPRLRHVCWCPMRTGGERGVWMRRGGWWESSRGGHDCGFLPEALSAQAPGALPQTSVTPKSHVREQNISTQRRPKRLFPDWISDSVLIHFHFIRWQYHYSA